MYIIRLRHSFNVYDLGLRRAHARPMFGRVETKFGKVSPLTKHSRAPQIKARSLFLLQLLPVHAPRHHSVPLVRPTPGFSWLVAAEVGMYAWQSETEPLEQHSTQVFKSKIDGETTTTRNHVAPS